MKFFTEELQTLLIKTLFGLFLFQQLENGLKVFPENKRVIANYHPL